MSSFFFSDITVKLKTQEIPAHRFVLAARNEDWSLQSLSNGAVLGKHLEQFPHYRHLRITYNRHKKKIKTYYNP